MTLQILCTMFFNNSIYYHMQQICIMFNFLQSYRIFFFFFL